jgi:hypothetical protein
MLEESQVSNRIVIVPGVIFLSLAAGVACGSPGASSASSTSASSTLAEATSSSSGSSGGGGVPAGHACPTEGVGAIVATGATCLTMTPVDTGAAASGENADKPHYALFPSASPNGRLVLFLNGSGGHPADSIASPAQNFYDAATSLGYAVLALSYRSNTEVAVLCAGASADTCFFPSRQTLIFGVYQPDAAASLESIQLDEGIADRAVLALEWLAHNDPGHGWSAFLTGDAGSDPTQRLAWGNVVAAGHSQGGGHATAIGKLFHVSSVVQLSAPCDSVSGMPASWLSQSTGTWQSDSTRFWGLDVATGSAPSGGDTTCPTHAQAWQSLGMMPSRSNDAAMTCAAVSLVHNASILCPENESAWTAMLQ